MLSEAEAKEIMKGGLGKAELEFVTSLTAQLYWIIKEGDSGLKVRNGSAFFLDAGEGPFGVTAYHVLKKLNEGRSMSKVIACQIGHDLVFDIDGKNSIIDAHDDIDIATFKITIDEIKSINKTILTGYQKTWPPKPPMENRGIYFSGFPETERIGPSLNNLIDFGAAPLSGIASSISDLDVSSRIEREHLINVMGKGLLPENFDFSGISGAPMLTVIESSSGLRSWSLAGVIYKGPNTSEEPSEAIAGLEIIKARRAYFIQPNGRLNTQLWESLNFSKKRNTH
ncbi:MAG: hypothetical protein WBV23_04520 [Desulfobaccales bacterium]